MSRELIVLECPDCGETSDVVICQCNGSTDLLPDWCENCEGDLGPSYDSGEWAYA